MRHRPLGEKEWGPRPLRSWHEDQEWGRKDLTEKERQRVEEDDILMLRMIMLFIVAEEVRKVNGVKTPTQFAIEQPAVPKEEEVVSWWKTGIWKMMVKIYGFKESTFDQWNWGGKAHKPTTVGGTIEVEAPPRIPGGKKREVEGKTPEELLKESRQLARWAPGMMRALAEQVVEKVCGRKPKMRPLSWDEHVRANHTPFRRDCRICQEAMAKASPHRKAGHARAGVLSLDLSGPFKRAKDILKGTHAKFLLVGVYTWIDPRPGGHPAPDEEEVEVPDEAPDLEEGDGEVDPEKRPRGRPRKDDLAMRKEEEERKKWKEEGDAERAAEEAQRPQRGEPIEGGIFNDTDEEDAGRVREPEAAQADTSRVREPEAAQEDTHKQPKPTDGEEEEDDGGVKIRYCRMVLPIATKLAEDIVRAVQLFYLRLRSEGFVVNQIHTDRGGEFDNVKFQKWWEARAILKTWTPGDDPQCNGRCERAVQEVKAKIRVMLLQAGLGVDHWPLAARHLNEALQVARQDKKITWPPFFAKVLVRKRHWRSQELEPSQEMVTYLFPAWESHGHYIRDDQGWDRLSRTVMKNVQEPITDEKWIALENETNPVQVRRRLRSKMTVRQLKAPKEEEEEEERRVKMRRIQEVIRDEMGRVMEDDEANVHITMKELWKLRKFSEEEAPDEVLQTKVVGMQEVRRDFPKWKEAVENEIRSLFETKGALRKVSPEEMEERKKKGELDIIPSKLVCTLKPDPTNPKGKRKVRIVACGNFVTAEGADKNELFASGSDAIAVRLAVDEAAKRGWSGKSMDIRTAFLNAPMELDEEAEERKLKEKEEGKGPEEGRTEELRAHRVLVKPPMFLIQISDSPSLMNCGRQ